MCHSIGYGVWFLMAIAPLSAISAPKKCSTELTEDITQLAWRNQITHSLPGDSFSPTDAVRESMLKKTRQDMEDFIFGHTDVPEMEFFPATGVIENKTATWQSGKMPAITVGGLGKSQVLKGSLLLPVSGHCGAENARQWATTDTYSIFLVVGRKRQALVKDVKSLGVVTIQELSIPFVGGEPVKIEYHRSGSGGPAGFPGGRILEMTWDGT